MTTVPAHGHHTQPSKGLQAGSVDHLVVNDQLAATVIDDKGTDAATAILERLADATEEVALGNDGQAEDDTWLSKRVMSQTSHTTIITPTCECRK